MGKLWFLRVLCFWLLWSNVTSGFSAQGREATAASYVELGDKWARAGELGRAVSAYSIAIDFMPEFAQAFFKRGLVQQERGSFSEAISDYSKTLQIEPDCAEAYDNRAYLHAVQHEVAKAFADWSAALEINPRLITVFYN